MPRLDGDPHVGGEQCERPVEQLLIGPHRRRKLEQHRAEPVAQTGERVEHPAHGLLGVAQPPDVGEVPACLHRHHEPVRGPGAPLLE
jgi:hypothetical protein